MFEKLNITTAERLNSAKVLSGYKEIATFLGVSTRTLQRHLKSIPISRFGKKIIILESELVDWVKQKSSRIL